MMLLNRACTRNRCNALFERCTPALLKAFQARDSTVLSRPRHFSMHSSSDFTSSVSCFSAMLHSINMQVSPRHDFSSSSSSSLPSSSTLQSPRLLRAARDRRRRGRVQVESLATDQRTFKELGVASQVWSKLHWLKVERPSPIQSRVLNALLVSTYQLVPSDFVIQAPAGSGKTLAFLLPILSKINANQRSVQAIIVSARRELSVQIRETLRVLTTQRSKGKNRANKVQVLRLVGSKDENAVKIRALLKFSPPHIIIVTPQRLRTLLEPAASFRNRIREFGDINLKCLKYVVVDEVDAMTTNNTTSISQWMLDRIFGEGSKKNQSTARPQLLFSSSVISPATHALAMKYMLRPTLLTPNEAREMSKWSEDDETLSLARALPKHTTHVVAPFSVRKSAAADSNAWHARRASKEREDAVKCDLLVLINRALHSRVALVFLNKHPPERVQRLQHLLKERGFESAAMIQSMDRKERNRVYKAIAKGKVKFVFCGSFVARGMDFVGASDVVHFDGITFPVEYVHRSGRVGRLRGYANPYVVTLIDVSSGPRHMEALQEQCAALNVTLVPLKVLEKERAERDIIWKERLFLQKKAQTEHQTETHEQ